MRGKCLILATGCVLGAMLLWMLATMRADEPAAKPAKEAKLPFTVYAEDGEKWPWHPTGFMGSDVSVMSIDGKCKDNPHAGKTCLKFVYNSKEGWGGIVWQDPDNDWGTLPGGYDLTGAQGPHVLGSRRQRWRRHPSAWA